MKFGALATFYLVLIASCRRKGLEFTILEGKWPTLLFDNTVSACLNGKKRFYEVNSSELESFAVKQELARPMTPESTRGILIRPALYH